MKITVVTANYNGGRWLGRCMDSVLGQELPAGDELEYVFVDGGSGDDSMAIAEARRGRLAAIVSERDEGPADALNKGFRLATGDLVGWLNSDDAYRPGALAAALGAAKAGAPRPAGAAEAVPQAAGAAAPRRRAAGAARNGRWG